jgi:hypothetical protein
VITLETSTASRISTSPARIIGSGPVEIPLVTGKASTANAMKRNFAVLEKTLKAMEATA